MRLNRGCGCPIVILFLVDILMIVGAIISLIRGPSQEPFQASRVGTGLSLMVTLGNAVAAAILVIAAFRGQALGGSTTEAPSTEQEEEGVEVGAAEEEHE
jgi:hypothetical protein